MRPGEAYNLTIGGGPAPTLNAPVVFAHFDALPGSFENPYYPRTREEAVGLPSGAHFFAPDGILRERH